MLQVDMHACGLYRKRVLCAVSGGADSVALLRLLASARDQGEISLFAAHFEHGIRGKASTDDMEFVASLCSKINVPLTIGHGDVPGECKRTQDWLESCARRLRHEFLERTRKALQCDCIALAHHQRDRAETVLMHIMRGGGIRGAAAMPAKNGVLVRPLIAYSPDEIRKYLISINQPWREDETNQIDDNPRNALRLNIFPSLRKIYPSFERALCRFSDIACEEDALMEKMTDRYAAQCVRCFAGIWVLEKGETALMRRMMQRLMPESDFETTERALQAGKPADLTGGYSASSDGERLYISPPLFEPEAKKISLSEITVLEGVCELQAEDCDPLPIRRNGYTQVFAKEALQGADLRLWRKGDFIRPLGLCGSKSLGDYFTDRHFPAALRHRLPLVARGSEVLWVPGLGISEKLRVNETAPACRLTIKILGGYSDEE